jgi:hypothetical protein
MKRVMTGAFYAIGAIAIAYLALYAYFLLTGRNLRPGEPIRIFRKPDAPSYSDNIKEPVREARTGWKAVLVDHGIRPLPRTHDDRCCRRA